jgi:glucosamine-6-phosphate deaminase
LAHETRLANSRFFDGDLEQVPKQAITMGIKTILDAKRIILVATGEGKAEIMRKVLSAGAPTTDIPAACLYTHNNVQIHMDTAAAAGIESTTTRTTTNNN